MQSSKYIQLLTILGLILLGFTLASNSGGRATFGNSAATQAPGEQGNTCGSPACHGTNNFDPSMDFTIIDDNGLEVTTYELDATYTVRITLAAALGTPIGWGFQAVTLDESDEAYNAWGDNLPGGTALTTLANGRTYFEHNFLLPNDIFEIDWSAPSEDLGNITFYGAANAANGNGSRSGDGGTTTTFTLASPLLSNTQDIDIGSEITIISNPISTGILRYTSDVDIDMIKIFDLSGRIVYSQESTIESLDISHLEQGLYLVRFAHEHVMHTERIIIQ